MLYDITENGIKFYEWIGSRHGADFDLYPIKEVHTQEDVKLAKKELLADYDVLSIRLTWVTQQESDEMYLFLHPIAEVNRQMNIELNKSKSL